MTDTQALRVAELPQNTPTLFELAPDAPARALLAQELGLIALRKLRFSGEITAYGKHDWQLKGKLGATVVQPCVVTLEPVTTRIDTEIHRLFLTELPEDEAPDVEMPEDDNSEKLGAWIDPAAVMAEALALALPLYPRKQDVELGEAIFTEPGKAPMRDKDTRPFAGLSGLRDALKQGK